MSSLTEQERIGLEEVFLSISSQNKRLGRIYTFKQKLKQTLKRTHPAKGVKKGAKRLFKARKQINFPNFHHLFPKRNKKKKNLS